MTAPFEIASAGVPVLPTGGSLAPRPPALVLLGRDGAGRPRAAWFDAIDAEMATVAAATMRLRVLPLADEAGRDLAGQIARGRVLPNGRAHVPMAKRDLYARLTALRGEDAGRAAASGERAEPVIASDGVAAVSAEQADASAAENAGTPMSSGDKRLLGDGKASPLMASATADKRPGANQFVGQPRPGARDEIGLGSLVLAHEGPEDGWWEAEVIGADGPTFSLRWRDYPTQPTILRNADQLALLPPGGR